MPSHQSLRVSLFFQGVAPELAGIALVPVSVGLYWQAQSVETIAWSAINIRIRILIHLESV